MNKCCFCYKLFDNESLLFLIHPTGRVTTRVLGENQVTSPGAPLSTKPKMSCSPLDILISLQFMLFLQMHLSCDNNHFVFRFLVVEGEGGLTYCSFEDVKNICGQHCFTLKLFTDVQKKVNCHIRTSSLLYEQIIWLVEAS